MEWTPTLTTTPGGHITRPSEVHVSGQSYLGTAHWYANTWVRCCCLQQYPVLAYRKSKINSPFSQLRGTPSPDHSASHSTPPGAQNEHALTRTDAQNVDLSHTELTTATISPDGCKPQPPATQVKISYALLIMNFDYFLRGYDANLRRFLWLGLSHGFMLHAKHTLSLFSSIHRSVLQYRVYVSELDLGRINEPLILRLLSRLSYHLSG